MQRRVPLCHKCSDRVMGPPGSRFGARELHGCEKLSATEWDEGWYSDDFDTEGPYQHNCPLNLVLRVEQELPVPGSGV